MAVVCVHNITSTAKADRSLFNREGVVTAPKDVPHIKPTSTGLEVKSRRLRSSGAVRESTVYVTDPELWTSFEKRPPNSPMHRWPAS